MLLIQVILVFAILLMILRLISKLKSKNIYVREFFGWMFIWSSAILVILFPDLSSYLAMKVGVTRGVDLVIYVSVVIIFYLLFRLLMRIEKIEKDITKISRHIALKDSNKE